MTTPAEVLSGEARWCVVNADCLDVMRELPEKIGATLVTDPPFGVNLGSEESKKGTGLRMDAYASHDDSYEAFLADVVPRINLTLDMCVRGAVFSGPHIHEQRKPDAIGGIHCPSACGRHCWGFKTFLPVLFYGKAPTGAGMLPTSLISTERADREGHDHPVPKPLGWMLWLVNLASRENDVVFDPFCGTGTTGVAALRLGRRFIGIEKDAAYAQTARDSLSAEQDGSSLKAVRAGQAPLFGTGNE